MVNHRSYYYNSLVSWVLRFARRGRIDTYTARDCCNPDSRLVANWQKAVEINFTLFFCAARKN
jgi:hypothetical protein